MRATDKKYFDKYAVDPLREESMFDSFVEEWVDGIGNEDPESDEFYVNNWDELV